MKFLKKILLAVVFTIMLFSFNRGVSNLFYYQKIDEGIEQINKINPVRLVGNLKDDQIKEVFSKLSDDGYYFDNSFYYESNVNHRKITVAYINKEFYEFSGIESDVEFRDSDFSSIRIENVLVSENLKKIYSKNRQYYINGIPIRIKGYIDSSKNYLSLTRNHLINLKDTILIPVDKDLFNRSKILKRSYIENTIFNEGELKGKDLDFKEENILDRLNKNRKNKKNYFLIEITFAILVFTLWIFVLSKKMKSIKLIDLFSIGFIALGIQILLYQMGFFISGDMIFVISNIFLIFLSIIMINAMRF